MPVATMRVASEHVYFEISLVLRPLSLSLTDWNWIYRRASRQASPVFQRSRDFTTKGLLSV